MPIALLHHAVRPADRIRRRIVAALAFLGVVCAVGRVSAQSAPKASTPDAAQSDVVTLPAVTVEEESLRDYPFFPKADVKPPGFADRSPPVDLFYPGKAYVDGVSEGSATVGVMLDEDGKPTDYLLIRYTQPYFGEALMNEAHEQQFSPRRVKGVAVPGRFDFGYRFVPTVVLQMNDFDAIRERNMIIEGGPRFIYGPHAEHDIDGGGLVQTKRAFALLPDGFAAPAGKTVKALVSFYVDETGHVRLPSVESAASPLLIPNAIKAVEHWEFAPPTIKGRPVLVYTLWSVFYIEPAAAAATSRGASRKP